MGPPQGIDHLVFAAPSLATGTEMIESLLGVRPVPGGRHPAFGTHNALVALAAEVYLEIIAPDPGLPVPARGIAFRAGEAERPRLVTWALRSRAIEATSRAAGLGCVSSARRERSDGVLLEWQLSDPYVDRCGGVVPFLIDWGDTPHPAGSAPAAGELVGLRLEHPSPGSVRETLRLLELVLEVTAASEPGLVAVVDTTRGRVELR